MKGIYKITSPTGKVYIGQSINIRLRWNMHTFESRRKSYKYPLYLSMAKYGAHNHKLEVIHLLPNDVGSITLTIYEQFYIDQYKSCGVELLNINPAAGSRTGTKHSAEARAKISKANKPWTEEHRNNWITALKRRTGTPLSEETKKKISERARGRSNPKLSISQTGRKLTEEWKKNIGLGGLGKKDSDQVRANKKKAARLRWDKKKGGNNAIS